MTDATGSTLHGRFKMLLLACFFFIGALPAALAQETGDCSYDAYNAALGIREGSGDYSTDTGNGMIGAFQFSRAALIDLGFTDANGNWPGRRGITRSQFLTGSNAQSIQENAIRDFDQIRWGYATAEGLQNRGYSSSAIMAGCHLLGCAGLRACLDGTGACTDGYNTNVHEYLQKFSGYDTPFADDGGSCTDNGPYTGPARSETYGNPLCDENIRDAMIERTKTVATFRQDAMRQTIAPPASVEQIANTPCVSKELQKITNQFADAPNALLGSLTGSLGGAMGPASGIMNKMFESSFGSLNDAAAFMPQMLNFQSQASGVLSGLLGSLGGTDAFSSELCGMMIDMVVKFVQCQFPMQMPSFGDIGITGSLNDLLPDGCAGEAARDALYGAASMSTWDVLSQPMTATSNGTIRPGNAQTLNQQRRADEADTR